MPAGNDLPSISKVSMRQYVNRHLLLFHTICKTSKHSLSKFKQIIIPELNTGQLLKLVREAFLVDARGINKVAGEPFTAQELTDKIEEIINE